MNNSQLLIAGSIGGLALALGIAALYSTVTAASAQMMQHQGMDMSSMGSGMGMSGGLHQSKMFSGSGHSAVSNVQVTGIAVTGDNEVTVYLKYTGAEAAPSVVIVAHTNMMDMMSMMLGGMSGMGGMQGMGEMSHGGSMMGGMSSMHVTNSTSTMQQPSSLQVGSTAVSAGWKNGAFKVKLQGDGSAYDASDIMAMVFPLTS